VAGSGGAGERLSRAACGPRAPGYNGAVELPKGLMVPELLEPGQRETEGRGVAAAPAIPRPPLADPRLARKELKRQIARLERELAELFVTSFPRQGIEWGVGAAGGPRLLGLTELEQIRDGLAVRLAEAREELGRRVDVEESNRSLVERMIADPEEYRWVRVSNEDVGERGCKHWHSRPRFGILGMLLGWWRVKLSSGCPLATGRRPPAPAPNWTLRRLRSAADDGFEV
jgi:hypothetical protein